MPLIRNVRWLPLFCLLLVLSGCQSVTPQVAKVALVAPFEGEQRELGYDGIYAARLAVREFNSAQQTAGSDLRLALVALDDGGDADTAAGNGQALAADPAIIAVVGMGNDQTRLATSENLSSTSIVFIHSGVFPFEATDPAQLPADFKDRYAVTTPFDEVAGEQAGSVYEAFELITFAIREIEAENRSVSAESVAEILKSAKIKGITGKSIFWDSAAVRQE